MGNGAASHGLQTIVRKDGGLGENPPEDLTKNREPPGWWDPAAARFREHGDQH
jgi:hypothetical protein